MNGPGVESPEFRLAVRVMSKRREVALELNEETGVAIPEFSATARLSDGPSVVGRRLREVLRLTQEEQNAWRDDWQAWRRWPGCRRG